MLPLWVQHLLKGLGRDRKEARVALTHAAKKMLGSSRLHALAHLLDPKKKKKKI
jgi:hypothetical protein